MVQVVEYPLQGGGSVLVQVDDAPRVTAEAAEILLRTWKRAGHTS
jgi:hypothetical protein